MDHFITATCRDVCGKMAGSGGFEGVAFHSVDAVFLDLPEPWLAIDDAIRVLQPRKILCCYSLRHISWILFQIAWVSYADPSLRVGQSTSISLFLLRLFQRLLLSPLGREVHSRRAGMLRKPMNFSREILPPQKEPPQSRDFDAYSTVILSDKYFHTR